MPSKKKVEQKVVKEPVAPVAKKKEVTKVPTKAEILKAFALDVALLVDVVPEDKHEILCGIFEKALFRETVRHYATKSEMELRKDLTEYQVKKLDKVIKALVKIKAVVE